MTTNFGATINNNKFSLTAGPHGPILLSDHFLLEKLQRLVRERVIERMVHAKGAGAHGYFISTKDMSAYTRANIYTGNNKKT